MKALSEWKPFVTLDFKSRKARNVAINMQRPEEQIQLWPYNCIGKTFIVAIYAKTFFLPPKFQPEGFLILNENAEILQDSFFVKGWHVTFSFGIGYIFILQQSIYRLERNSSLN